MFEPDTHITANQYLFGIPTQHSPLAVWMLEQILNRYRPGAIVEIGTFMGGLTTYLGTWALNNSARVLSVDNNPRLSETTKKHLQHLDVYLEHRDAYEPGFVRFVQSFIAHGDRNTLIYCDGGKKIKELKIYGEVAPRGSIIGCHDYGTEVIPAAAETYMQRYGYKKLIQPERLRELGTLQQFWIRKGKHESKSNHSDIQPGPPVTAGP